MGGNNADDQHGDREGNEIDGLKAAAACEYQDHTQRLALIQRDTAVLIEHIKALSQGDHHEAAVAESVNECPKCTFINLSSWTDCAVCNSPRPANPVPAIAEQKQRANESAALTEICVSLASAQAALEDHIHIRNDQYSQRHGHGHRLDRFFGPFCVVLVLVALKIVPAFLLFLSFIACWLFMPVELARKIQGHAMRAGHALGATASKLASRKRTPSSKMSLRGVIMTMVFFLAVSQCFIAGFVHGRGQRFR